MTEEEEEQVFIANSNGTVWMIQNIPTPQITVEQKDCVKNYPLGMYTYKSVNTARNPCFSFVVDLISRLCECECEIQRS